MYHTNFHMPVYYISVRPNGSRTNVSKVRHVQTNTEIHVVPEKGQIVIYTH